MIEGLLIVIAGAVLTGVFVCKLAKLFNVDPHSRSIEDEVKNS